MEIDDILDLNGSKLINLGTPTEDTDGATKKYVDDNAGGSGDMSTSTYDTDDDGTVNAADTALALVGIEAPTPAAGDDGKYFNPLEQYQKQASDDSYTQNGIRLIHEMAKSMDYRNTVRLNNLIVRI